MPHFFSEYVRFLASLCAMLVLMSSLSMLAYAQQSVHDFEAPIIEHDSFEFSASDPIQAFTATVADNTGLRVVRLFYRFQGEADYRAEDMNSIVDSSVYTARISTENVESSIIEYYIQAEDLAGNVVLKGYAFAPLERVLSLPTAPLPAAEAEPAIIAEKPKSKVLYYVLGALALGALAGLAGGGSGGGRIANDGTPTTDTCGDAGCLVTFTLGSP